MQSTKFHQANYISGQVILEVQNVHHLVSWSLESIPPNHIYQENFSPSAPMFAPVSNTTICFNDNVQLHMIDLIKSLQEEVKTLKTNLTNNTTNYELGKCEK